MSLEGNKIVGAVLLAGVVAMGSGYASQVLTGSFGHHESHDDDHGSGLGKVIPLPEVADAGATKPKAEAILEPVLPLLASADLAKGEKLTKRCTACHSFNDGGAIKVGPNLWDTINRDIAAVEGFSYGGLKEKAGEQWTYANLNGFLAKPKKWAPGTKMNFAGLKSVNDRAALIAYMRSLSSNPAPIE